jgi:hypothetical protein
VPGAGDGLGKIHDGPHEAQASLAALLGRKRAKYTAIYDVLGRDVFVRWYLEFPRRFSPEAISLMRKKTDHVDMGQPYETDDETHGLGQEKSDLIEEALFLNLLLSVPDTVASSGVGGDGDQQSGKHGQQREGASRSSKPV